MSYQHIPSSCDRSHDQLKHNLMHLPTPNSTNDWHSQRSLYMGSNITPQYHCQVSYSPPLIIDASCRSSRSSSSSDTDTTSKTTFQVKYFTLRRPINKVTLGIIMIPCSFLSLQSHRQVHHMPHTQIHVLL
jgi:hypothetical protein